MPPDQPSRAEEARPRLTREEWRRTALIASLQGPGVLCYAAASQAYGLMFVWAGKAVDMNIGGLRLPVTWMMTADGVLTIAGVYLAAAVWKALAARGREPHDLNKVAIGYSIVALAFVFIGAVARAPVAPLVLWLLFYAILDVAYAWTDPPNLALTTRNAPRPLAGMVLAVSSLSAAASYFLLGWLGQFFEVLGPATYWTMTAALPGAAALMLFLVGPTVNRVLELGGSASAATGPALEAVV